MPARLVGLYALACMERDGVVYGYSLADRIAERTGNAWRPGPGAVYPALRRLQERGLATVRGADRRREYRITPAGRRLLARFRKERVFPGSSGPDLGLLWAEISGISNAPAFLLHRLRRNLDGIESYLGRDPDARVGRRPLRADVLAELRATQNRLQRPRSRRTPGRRP